MSRFGSRVSSAASGTPSTARKNQIAKTNAAQMPAKPNGRKSDEPAASVGAMSVRFERVELGDHRDDEDDQRDDRDRRDHEHHLERLADADQVDADEDGVEDEVDRPAGVDADVERLDVAADEHDDRGRRDRVLDQDRRAGQEAAPRAERAAAEAVAAAGGRDRRRQLREREDHARVHRPHQDRGDQQAAPAALGEAEVPAGEVARDHVRDAEPGEQDPARRALLQLPLLHVLAADLLVLDAPACTALLCHLRSPQRKV